MIREGEPALKPLQICFAADRRLTRQGNSRAFNPLDHRYGYVKSAVFETIDDILTTICHEVHGSDGWPRNRVEAPAELPDIGSRLANRQSQIERWFAILADDKEDQSRWADAALALVSKRERPVGPNGTALWPRLQADTQLKVDCVDWVGEPLRSRKNPSLTDLLVKRLQHTKSSYFAGPIANALIDWDLPKAIKSLPGLMDYFQDEKSSRWWVYAIMLKRVEAGDLRALEEYPAWIHSVNQPNLNWTHFDPMEKFPNHPQVAEAAEWLFSGRDSPCVPLFPNLSNDGTRDHSHLLRRPLMYGVASFRKAVIDALFDKNGHYEMDATSNDCLWRNYPLAFGRRLTIDATNRLDPLSKTKLDFPKKGLKGTFRNCDYVAWLIGEHLVGAPRCELWWPEAERDKAVTACIGFLMRFADRLPHLKEAVKLPKPATSEEARYGHAVFSLEGEGETRLVAGLKLPLEARWLTLKDQPVGTVTIDPKSGKEIIKPTWRQEGHIVQAEEVFKDGRWQRYYGFVGANRVERVPASEIEFLSEPNMYEADRQWRRVASQFDARLLVPEIQVEAYEGYPPRVPADAKLLFGLSLFNASGLDATAPDLNKSVRLKLLYSPEIVIRGALAPKATRDEEWIELRIKAGAAFRTEPKKTYRPAEQAKAATFDLREWFDLNKPGFYRLSVVPTDKNVGEATGPAGELRFSQAP